MIDYSHLDALNFGLSNERVRLANAKTEQERELRKVWVEGLEKEISRERVFLGLPVVEEVCSMDELDAFMETFGK